MKIISIHQPETFPYAGYFNKMMNSDEFIILDNVQFKKNNYQNRNRIVHEGKPKWLTFPVIDKGRLESTIASTKLANTVDWRSRNLKVLEDAYKDCPYFYYHMPTLKHIIKYSDDNLLLLNMAVINYIRECLHIKTDIIYASDLDVTSHKSDLVFDICKARGADAYLSGKGGRDYLDTSKFDEEGIIVQYQEFIDNIPYVQKSDEFIPYMSVIDLLMNNSNGDATDYVRSVFRYNT